MEKELLEWILNETLKKDIDFSDIFYENTSKSLLVFLNSKLDRVSTSSIEGVGIRLIKNDNQVYINTNDLSKDNLKTLIDDISVMYEDRKNSKEVKLKESYVKNKHIDKYEIDNEDKLKLLCHLDKYARKLDDRITQVQMKLFEEEQNVVIANTDEKYIKDKRNRKRLDISIYVKENDRLEYAVNKVSCSGGFECINKNDLEKLVRDTAKTALEKLNSVPCKGGRMSVVLEHGFGGVIFHEACGHSLEATAIVRKIGPFVNKINKKIASDKVTLIDDGTLTNEWGSINIDDEGNKAKKNVLIKNGVLKTYLVDYYSSKIMKDDITSSSRRESYEFLPTSRMTNTYLDKGKDKIEDMIKSIDYGLYAKSMGGGSVDILTGNFNFSVSQAYMIRDGKICEAVSDACLIGNGKDILKNVEMVGADLKLEAGYCTSDSGTIPVQVGQPTIKVSNILVSGRGED